ncbi:hypothetical protein T4D_7748 [Trichinella pseudospiralis]|uniref:Uncharacterized protein n=1 Tax=Trichinella pseudospiralis TaxID=6337 RepID=A0A0V1E036_TRIPS|nr:hypothetical protein T4D_7748 [Trichinella pseudospiralis]
MRVQVLECPSRLPSVRPKGQRAGNKRQRQEIEDEGEGEGNKGEGKGRGFGLLDFNALIAGSLQVRSGN